MKFYSLAMPSCVFIVLCLSACGIAEVVPATMSQPGDEQLTCAEIDSQLKQNSEDAKEFHQKDSDTKTANVVKNLIPPFVFLTDLSNEDQIKERALIDRNEKLDYLAKTKGCEKS